MTVSKRAIATDLTKLDAHKVQPEEYEDAPELTDQFFERAEHRVDARIIRRGRPPLERPKQLVSLRLDKDIIEHFRATGRGWQSRINMALRDHLKPKRRA
jgi:uncharacterized protein (DUF4415 family)